MNIAKCSDVKVISNIILSIDGKNHVFYYKNYIIDVDDRLMTFIE
ncbi:hypothetical protein Echvi_0720 [Echinicola vietnamensis DSM 17526]|uniref:Uncharacterized protein n=1 Tax=Echinicola vietnamensis (strain DSM 17526 / LMG 23754 / KMM 6221) TaxID=926556 RepID=L0FUP1_ECHVK|nr:hypothetical protein Echvi_0720 [Echinicola vietnamensis DSM 17526]